MLPENIVKFIEGGGSLIVRKDKHDFLSLALITQRYSSQQITEGRGKTPCEAVASLSETMRLRHDKKG